MKVITKANNVLNGISSSSVCTEVIQSAQGMEYLLGEEAQTRHTRSSTDCQQAVTDREDSSGPLSVCPSQGKRPGSF